MSGSWKSEILFLLACWLSFATIGILFLEYDGEPLPQWPLDLSLSSVVSIPARIIEATIACVIYSVTFQLLYLRYHQEARAIEDVEIFAKAARTIQGAFKLVKLQRFFGLASSLALMQVVSHAISTNIQQAITARASLVPFGIGTVPIATRVSRRLSSSSSVANLDNAMLTTMWSGFLDSSGNTSLVPATCDGANQCNFDNYSTIAVSHRCEDLSDEVVPCSTPASDCSFMLPATGGPLTVGIDQKYTSMAYFFPDFLAGYGEYIAAWKTLGIGEDPRNSTPAAIQCKMYFTVQTYSGSMVNGSFEEHLIAAPWYNTTTLASEEPEWIMDYNGSASNILSVSGTTADSMSRFLFNFLTANSTAITEGLDFAGRDQHQIQYTSLMDGSLNDRIDSFAAALSQTIRVGTPIDTLYNSPKSLPTQITCQSMKQEERLHVTWYWLIPTLVVLIFTTTIFIRTIVLTRSAKVLIHKGNTLALLSWAPSDVSREKMNEDTESLDLRKTKNARFISLQAEHEYGPRLTYVGTGKRPSPSYLQRVRAAIGRRKSARHKLNET